MEAGIAAGLVIAAVIVTVTVGLNSGSSDHNATIRTSSHPSTTVGTTPTRPASSSTGPQISPTTVPPNTTVTTAPATTLPAATSPGAPQLSSISPAGGTAGQVVTISGTNFISSNGVVVASFNGQLAGTVCSVQTACSVTVPALGAAPVNVVVTVTTAAGTSNGLAFSYT